MAYVWRTEKFIHFWSEEKKKEYQSTHTQKKWGQGEQTKPPSFGTPSALEQFLDELMQPAVTQTLAALFVHLLHNDQSNWIFNNSICIL